MPGTTNNLTTMTYDAAVRIIEGMKDDPCRATNPYYQSARAFLVQHRASVSRPVIKSNDIIA